jgi:hypothetical protein
MRQSVHAAPEQWSVIVDLRGCRTSELLDEGRALYRDSFAIGIV